MGTLCKNCPVRNIHQKTGESCTSAFAKRYGNSCVNLDIAQMLFEEELNKLSEEKKTPKNPSTKKSTPKKASVKKPKGEKKVKVEVVQEEVVAESV